jgi:hypothetical protein
MKCVRACLAVMLVLTQTGCADILPWPGFESQPGIFSYTEQLPAVLVARQVRCELAKFLDEETTALGVRNGDNPAYPRFLDESKGAQVQLKLTTDLQGSVTYLGIDLKGLGLSAVASLVTTANNTPSLQLKAQGKSTQIAQLDYVIPQVLGPTIKAKDQYVAEKDPKDKDKQAKDDKGNPLFIRVKSADVTLPDNLQLTPCSPQVTQNAWFRLWLGDSLQRYKDRIEAESHFHGITFSDSVCAPKLTISTQFQLLFDISAGTSILKAVPILLPVSGLNIDASPDYTHSIQIIFSLRPVGRFDLNGNPYKDDLDTKNRVDACAALQTQNPPSHT